MALVRRKGLLILSATILLGSGLLLLPFIILTLQSLYGSLTSSPHDFCEVMDKNRLEKAISDGFNVNTGCCAEHMIGECSLARPNSSPLVFAVENNNVDAVKTLLEHGADPNASTESGYALGVAAALNQIEIAELILSHGATPESHNIGLRMAAHSGNTTLAQLILSHISPEQRGASCEKLACSLVSELDQTGSSHLPAQRELFLHIINTCLDPNIFCEPFRLLSSLARREENVLLVEALIARGADLNAKEKNGKTVRDFLRSFEDYDSRPRIKAIIEEQ